jgi:hypothetical protein
MKDFFTAVFVNFVTFHIPLRKTQKMEYTIGKYNSTPMGGTAISIGTII